MAFENKQKGYELLDSGYGRKLERFGEVILERPCSQAIWVPSLERRAWDSAESSSTFPSLILDILASSPSNARNGGGSASRLKRGANEVGRLHLFSIYSHTLAVLRWQRHLQAVLCVTWMRHAAWCSGQVKTPR